VCGELKVGHCDLLLKFYEKNIVRPITFNVLGLGSSYLGTKFICGVRVCRELKIGHCDLLLKVY